MAAFIFILPFAHTIALRLALLALLTVTALTVRYRERTPPLPLKWPLMAVAAISMLSITWAVDPALSFGEAKREILLTFLAFFAGFVLTRSRADFVFYTWTMLGGFGVLVALGCVSPSLSGRWANFGFQGDVGTYSTYIITIVPWALAALVLARGFVVRAALFGVIGFAIYAGFLTSNRAFFLAVVAVVVTFAALTIPLFSLRLAKKVLVGVVVAAVLGGVIGLFALVVEGRGNSSADLVSGIERAFVSDVRLPFWRESIGVMREHLWLGVGFGARSFSIAYPQFLQESESFWHVHNLFLNRYAQTGLVGLAVFIFLLTALVRQASAMYTHKHTRELRVIGAAGLALLLGVVVKNFTDDFFGREIALLTWTMIGIVLGYVARYRYTVSEG